jgi:hypothetical protein
MRASLATEDKHLHAQAWIVLELPALLRPFMSRHCYFVGSGKPVNASGSPECGESRHQRPRKHQKVIGATHPDSHQRTHERACAEARMQARVAGNGHIFISVASYRDPECGARSTQHATNGMHVCIRDTSCSRRRTPHHSRY